MARPIWTGTLSFGLLNVPVSLMSGERRTDLHFRMLDSRDRKPANPFQSSIIQPPMSDFRTRLYQDLSVLLR